MITFYFVRHPYGKSGIICYVNVSGTRNPVCQKPLYVFLHAQ